MNRKWLVSLVLMLFTMGIPLSAFALEAEEGPLFYLNLGDSIALGMSAVDECYYLSYGDYLEPYGISAIPNGFAWPGLTSSQFLDLLSTESINVNPLKMQIAQADLITISLGGNNLLGPLVGGLYSAYGLSPVRDTMESLLIAINAGGAQRWQAVVQSLTLSAEDPLGLGGALEAGMATFEEDWPLILETMRQINPEGSIILLSLYNPFDKETHPQFHDLFEPWIKRMNLVMKKNQGKYLSLADIHGSFARAQGDVLFSLDWPVTLEKLDPHPTDYGHHLVFQELIKSRNIRGLLAV